MKLDFESFIHRGSLGDIYLGTLHIKNQSPIQVAVKVVIPDLYFRAAHLPKDDEDEEALDIDPDDSMDSEMTEANPSAEKIRALIINEARIYLSALAECPAAPKFYGLWQGRSAAPRLPQDDIVYDNLEILLLLTEYLPEPFDVATASQQDWDKITECHGQLSERGIAHDGTPEDWRGNDHAWYVIDFAKAHLDLDPPTTWDQGPGEWKEETLDKCDKVFDTVKAMAVVAQTSRYMVPPRSSLMM
jgi:hypothetical protein